MAIGKGAAASATLVTAIGKAITSWVASKGEAEAVKRASITFTHTEQSEGRRVATHFEITTDSPEMVIKQLKEFLEQKTS